VPIRDDEQFAKYLKQFRPVAPEELAVKEQVRTSRRRLLFAAWAALAAAILAAMMLLSLRFYQHLLPVTETGAGGSNVERLVNPQPLTIGSANALLASAPSFKAAVESVAFQSESRPLSEGRHSALAVLSKEENKL
jgi:hypothetical protein